MGIIPDQDVLRSWLMIIIISWWDFGPGEASHQPGKWRVEKGLGWLVME